VEQASVYNDERADELVFLDILASHEGRSTMVEMARRVADEVFIPFAIGGGVRYAAGRRGQMRHQQRRCAQPQLDQRGRLAIRIAMRGGGHRCPSAR
jgi:cyclase